MWILGWHGLEVEKQMPMEAKELLLKGDLVRKVILKDRPAEYEPHRLGNLEVRVL